MKKIKYPFNITEYEKGIYTVETNDGKPVRILCTNSKRRFPILALVEETNGHESVCEYTFDGTYDRHNYEEYNLFLTKEVFEDGDIVHTEDSINNIETISIFKEYENNDSIKKFYYHVKWFKYKGENNLYFDNWNGCNKIRIANEEEKKKLLDFLTKKGKYWDPNKKEILNVKDKMKEMVNIRCENIDLYNPKSKEFNYSGAAWTISTCTKKEEPVSKENIEQISVNIKINIPKEAFDANSWEEIFNKAKEYSTNELNKLEKLIEHNENKTF